MRIIHISTERVRRVIKTAAVVFIVAAYALVLVMRSTAPDMVPSIGPIGSTFSRIAGLWVDRSLDGTGSPQVAPASGGFDDDECGVAFLPVISQDGSMLLYGAVAEADLPWFDEPAPRLTELREQANAHRLVAAFRLTLPSPLWDEQHNVALAARYLAGRVVSPGETVSTLRTIGPFTAERGYRDGPGYAGGRIVSTMAGGVCKIATTLYNVAVLGRLTVVERHQHSLVAPYVPPGRDAALATGYKDFRFRNDHDTPVVLWAGMRDATLYVAMYGQYEPPAVEWHHEELSREPAPTLRRANPSLPPGQEMKVIQGHDGMTVRSWITVTYPDGRSERRDMGVDAYRPLPEVVEYGP